MISFKEGTTYQFTIETVSGNSFSYRATAESQTFPFMKTEELKIVSRTWASNNVYIDLTVRNTGTDSLTFVGAEINSGAVSSTSNATGSLAVNAQTVVRITPSSALTSGQKYEFAILTAAGNRYTYTATAP